ncbi:MAG: Chitinase [Labilithrix sp.]|nr:Chitinase [Labilithrix sp.]
MIDRTSRALAVGALVLVACSSSGDRNDAARVAPPPPPPAEAVRAFVAHRDARLDAPSFVWLAKHEAARFASAHEAATTSLHSVAQTFGLTEAALAAVEMASVDDASGSHRGPVIARFRQRERGIEVFRGGLAIAMTSSFEPVSASGFLARSLSGAEAPFVRSTREALDDAYRALTGGSSTFHSLDTAGDYERFDASGLAAPARVKKVLFPQPSGVVPAYYVEIEIAHGPAFSFVIAAGDGTVLLKNDLVRFDAFSYRTWSDPTTKIPWDGPQGNGIAPHLTGKPDGFKPTWQPSSLVTLQNYPFSKNDPWLPADATTLSGNNVRAYADLNAPDGIGGDSSPSISGPLAFDYAYDTTQSPGATPTNIAGSTTHLFYVTNFLHDWYYDLGFDEKAGNHQFDNYGRGGNGHDPLKAEAQDYDGRNNANATVPADGSSPRLQMYVFSGPSFAELKVLSPSPLVGSKSVGLAGFGKDEFDTTGTVVLGVDDQGVDASDACEALTNGVSGKIVLVHRGLCPFVQKAQNVQEAGGIGVIVANVAASAQPTVPPFMGGTSLAITIPILSLALADGQALEAAIPIGASVEMRRLLQTDLDGGIDTTIVAHEWGHVISGRLISDGAGLTTNQSGGLGEGWADFSALLLMARADDITSPAGAGWRGAYPNGAYATSGTGTDFYFGIRRVPYSIDFTKDPLTLKHISNGVALPANVPISFGEDGSFNSEVHATGEVWATMLWECYAALLRDPRYTFAQAQERMRRYYVASLALTPPDPTIIEARDAVLAAAFASDEKDYVLFWQAFGRRGAGVGAVGPAKDSGDNGGVTESYFVGNDVQIVAGPLTDNTISCDHDGILDEGEVGTFTLTIRNSGPGLLEHATVKLSSAHPGVTFLDGDTVNLEPLKPFGSTALKVRTQIAGGEPIKPVTVDVAVSDPTFADGRVAHAAVTARYQADEAPGTSSTDHVDTRGTAWAVAGEDTSNATKKWARVTTGLDGKWVVPNPFEVAEHRLTSPRFTIDGTTFELDVKHRWSFRISTRRKVDIDGGVIEVSVDKGKTWKDISELGTVDYTSTLDEARGDNSLKGRRAYGNKSPGYPDAWVTSRIKVDLKAHPEQVQIRFVHASGTGFSGAPGWEIDDVDLVGISSKPFWSFVEHADQCDPKGPTASAGEPITAKSKQTVTLTGSATHPQELPVTFTWSQVAGPPVKLTPNEATLSFEAPDVGTQTLVLTFALRADDGKLLSPAAHVDVTVVPADAVDFGAGGGGCSTSKRVVPRAGVSSFALTFVTLGFLALGVLARRRARRG